MNDFRMSCLINSPTERDKLQNNLNKLSDWCYRNGMEVNPTKRNAITFTCAKALLKFDHRIGQHNLVSTSLVNVLEITLDTNLHFSNHLNAAVNKRLGLFRRNTQDITSLSIHIDSRRLLELKFQKLIAQTLKNSDISDNNALTSLNVAPI